MDLLAQTTGPLRDSCIPVQPHQPRHHHSRVLQRAGENPLGGFYPSRRKLASLGDDSLSDVGASLWHGPHGPEFSLWHVMFVDATPPPCVTMYECVM